MMPAVHSTIDSRRAGRQSTIPALRSTPNSSTAKQHQTLVIAASKKGLDLHELRKMVGGSLRRLSAKECSDWIERLSGDALPNPPGGKPWPYPRRKARDTFRMVTADHIEQIGRLMLRYFENNQAAAIAWFRKNWKVDSPSDLLSTKDAGEVIRVLKEMVERKEGTLVTVASLIGNWKLAIGNLALLFLPACIITVAPLTPAVCPPPPTVYVPAPLPAGCIGADDIRVFELCVTGPKQLIPDREGLDLWGYRRLDEEHTMRGWQLYFLVCTQLDLDRDYDVDLFDLAVWLRGPTGGVP